MNAKTILVGLVALSIIGLPRSVSGQYDVYGGPCGVFGWGYGYQTTYSSDPIPYFSLHPPVYYGARVARTYGYGPFAYPPWVLTPGSEPPRAAMYTAAEGETADSSRQGRPPLRIDNPFVDQPEKGGTSKGQKSAGVRPQVVYPAAMARKTG
jgi:hypothetical protein